MVAGDGRHRLGEDRECVVLIVLHQYPSLRLVVSLVP